MSKVYKFSDDSYFDNPPCDCCAASMMEAYNSPDTDPNLGTAHSEEDCWVQAIITEIGRWNIPDDYEERLYEMTLEELKQDAFALNINVEIE